ncbi:MAG: DUF697 domain-containing protein [Dethiobacteria bacterium]|nr:YcjF family protein [Bacillota bacterium]MDW7730023.1 DUF697 domain-containing protein [Bacillota bacterium]
MYNSIKKALFIATFFLSVLFIIFIINQTSQLVSLAGGVHPILGQFTLFTLLVIYAAVVTVPLAALFSRPRTLFPPDEADKIAYSKYLVKLSERHKKNPHLKEVEINPGDVSTIEEAHRKLNILADEKIKEAASNVFIMTAISQYGALDAVIVIFSQLRMIWQVVLVYNQRPNFRELAYLYSNIFATAFLATKIENLEVLEDQLEPVIASVMGSSLSSLTPGFNAAANIITNSVIQGSANAFLTLRVGVIARQYCASLIRPERNSIRSAAIVQASSLLALVLGESTYKVTKAVLRATAKAGKRPFVYGQGVVTKTSRKTWDAGKATLHRSEELARKLGDAVKDKGKKIKFYFAKPEPDDEE